MGRRGVERQTIDHLTSREELFKEIYRRYHDEVHAFCRRRVGDSDADDAVAETFGVVWRKLESSVIAAERAWVFGIARNVVRNRWRATRRRQRLLSRVSGIRQREAPDPSEATAQAETRQRRVTEALRGLREADREILMMSAWDDLSANEIATILDISANAVHQRLHRAKKRLADAMSRLEENSSHRLATEEGRA